MEKKVIFVVEDDPTVGESLRLLLKKRGYSILLASNGKEALPLFRQRMVDLVITDLVMPKMDGIELLEAVKRLRPETEVIVISAQGTIEKAVQAMKLGAFDFIEKPINPRVISTAGGKGLGETDPDPSKSRFALETGGQIPFQEYRWKKCEDGEDLRTHPSYCSL